MSNIIKIKRGSSVPSSSDLEHYELGYRTGTTELYINDGGTYRQLGGGASTSGSNNQILTDDGSSGINSESELTYTSGELKVNRSGSVTNKVTITGGSTAVLDLNSTGDSFIEKDTGNSLYIANNAQDKDIYFRVNDGGSNVTAIQIDSSESARVRIPNDGQRLSFGADQDMQLSHESNNNYIATYAGNLILEQNTNDADIIFNCDDGSGGVTAYLTLDGSATFTHLHQNTGIAEGKKLFFDGGSDTYITSDSADFMQCFVGNVEAFRILESSSVAYFYAPDNARLGVGSGIDFTIRHDATNTYITNTTGDMNFVERDAGNINFRNNSGTSRLHINSTGNIGIGLTSQDKKLEVSGDIKISGGDYNGLFFENAAGTTNALFYQHTANAALIIKDIVNNADRVWFGYDGDVGIGINPSEKLTIKANGDTSQEVIKIRNSSQTEILSLGIDGSGDGYLNFNSSPAVINTNGGHLALTPGGSGNVGIGTSSPVGVLNVIVPTYSNRDTDAQHTIIANSGDAGKGLRIGYDNSGHKAYVNVLDPGVAWGDLILQDGAGKIGIGTGSPGNKFTVNSTGTHQASIQYDASTRLQISVEDSGRARFYTDNNANVGIESGGLYVQPTKKFFLDGGNDTYLHEVSANQIAFNTGGAEKMRLTTTGLGIGTASLGAGAKLNVVSGSSAYTAQFSRHDADDGLFLHSEAAGSHYNWLISTQDNVDAGFEITPSTAAGNRSFTTPAFVIKANTGNVGIGTNSPKTKLDIENSTAPTLDNDTHAGEALFLRSGGSGGDGNVQAVLAFGKADSSSRRSGSAIASVQTDSDADKVGIGFYTSDSSASSQTMDLRMLLNHTGNLHVDADVVAYSTSVSDERLKDNVKTIDNALDKVMELRGVEFDWNKGNRKGQKDLGLIAQEVEKVLPEIVREKKMAFIDNETYKTIDYDKVVGVLIEAIKEQQQQINELKEKLNG